MLYKKCRLIQNDGCQNNSIKVINYGDYAVNYERNGQYKKFGLINVDKMYRLENNLIFANYGCYENETMDGVIYTTLLKIICMGIRRKSNKTAICILNILHNTGNRFKNVKFVEQMLSEINMNNFEIFGYLLKIPEIWTIHLHGCLNERIINIIELCLTNNCHVSTLLENMEKYDYLEIGSIYDKYDDVENCYRYYEMANQNNNGDASKYFLEKIDKKNLSEDDIIGIYKRAIRVKNINILKFFKDKINKEKMIKKMNKHVYSEDIIKFFCENFTLSNNFVLNVIKNNIENPATIKYIVKKYQIKAKQNFLQEILKNIKKRYPIFFDSRKKSILTNKNIIESITYLIKSEYFYTSSDFLLQYKQHYISDYDNNIILNECIKLHYFKLNNDNYIMKYILENAEKSNIDLLAKKYDFFHNFILVRLESENKT
jgi:hypothetical protein